MSRIRLNLRRLSITDKIAKGRHYVTNLTNNPKFTNPQPPLADLTTAVDDLEKAFASVQSARSEVTTRIVTQDNAEKTLDQALTQLAGYVESVAGRDDSLIASIGFGNQILTFCDNGSERAASTQRQCR